MNFYQCCLLLCFIGCGHAYKSEVSKHYGMVYGSGFCALGNKPVCGTNGYENFLLDNECEFNNFNSKELEKGHMVLSKISLDSCYPNQTYSSYSSYSYKGYCPQYCNKASKPLCASFRNEQRNFTNECELKKHICETKENWQIVNNGTCVPPDCAFDGQMICAAYNNYTISFPNLLSLYSDIQTTGRNWEILNVGPCPCPEDYRPICAQLNCTAKTFQNECFLERENYNGSLWSLLFFGECPELPSTAAPTTDDDEETTDDDDEVEGSGDDDDDDEDNDETTVTDKPVTEASTSAKNKPVYVVKNNKITPYVPSAYSNKIQIASAKSVYSSYLPTNKYQDMYKKPTNGLYGSGSNSQTQFYSDPYLSTYNSKRVHNPAPNVPSTNYQTYSKSVSFVKDPVAISTMTASCSKHNYRNDGDDDVVISYAFKPQMKLNYQRPYQHKHSVATSYYKTQHINYEGDSSNIEDLYDSFT